MGSSTPYIEIVNWERYQHYTKRNPPWIKLYHALLDDIEFMRLPPATRWIAIGLFLLASREENCIPYDLEAIQWRLRLPEPPDLSAIQDAGLIRVVHNDSTVIASGKRNGVTEAEAETEEESEKKLHTGGSENGDPEEKTKIVRACWEAWKELNEHWWDVEQMKLTSKRRKKLGKLYEEQLAPRADEYDPVELFRQIMETALEHRWWGTDRTKVKPETLFRSTEKREERTLEALASPEERRSGPQRPSDRILGRSSEET